MRLSEGTKRALSSAVEGQSDWYAIHDALRVGAPEESDLQIRALIWAYGFMYSPPDHVEQRAREGSPFGPIFEFAEGRMPPRLDQIPTAEVEVWAAAYDAFDEPRVRGRIGDLLWERRHQPRPDEKARAAVRALVTLSVDPNWETMEQTDALVRALEVASGLNDAELLGEVVKSAVARVETEIGEVEYQPGVPFSILTALVDLSEQSRPDELRSLIPRIEARYAGDVHMIDSAIDLQSLVSPQADQQSLRSRQVDAWEEAAESAGGILRLSHLEKALEVARTFGPQDRAEALRMKLAQVSDGDLDLKEVSAEVRVPSAKIEQFVNQFSEPDTWAAALDRFGSYGPPGGEPGAIDKEIERQRRASPIQFLVTKVVIDPDMNLAILKATDDASHTRIARAHQRLSAARFWGVFACEAFARMDAKLGRPSVAEGRALFTSEFIPIETADRLSRGLCRWFDGAPDESAHLVAPSLEAVIRGIARDLGIPIINEPRGEKPGGVRSLGTLLMALEGRLTSAGWRAYLFNLLSDPLGLNLRNVIGHGLRAEISREDAALLLHAACYLRLLSPGPASDDEKTPGPDPPGVTQTQ